MLYCCCCATSVVEPKPIINDKNKIKSTITDTDRMQKNICSYNRKIEFKDKEYINKGGFGEIYKLKDTNIDEEIVVKVTWQGTRKRALQEAKILLDLNGNYAPKFYRFEIFDHNYYIVMSYIKGKDLFEYFKNTAIFYNDAIEILKKVIFALYDIYKLGYMHLDVKLENIIYNEQNKQITLVDFGSGHITTNKLKKLQCNVGTLNYCAPEIYLRFYHPTSDIYSLGCVLWVLVSGIYPFDIKYKSEGWERIPENFPNSSNKRLYDKLPIPIQTLLRKMMRKNCKKRIKYPELINYIKNINGNDLSI